MKTTGEEAAWTWVVRGLTGPKYRWATGVRALGPNLQNRSAESAAVSAETGKASATDPRNARATGDPAIAPLSTETRTEVSAETEVAGLRGRETASSATGAMTGTGASRAALRTICPRKGVSRRSVLQCSCS